MSTTIPAFDERAIDALVEQHHGAMMRLAKSIVGPALAEEVVQESWIKILRGLDDFQGRSQIKTWLLRIVSNEAVSLLRKQSRAPEPPVADAADGDELDQRFDAGGTWSVPPSTWSMDTPEELFARDELRALLLEKIQSLPTMQRAVFTLRDIEGQDYSEIAAILNVNVSNVRVLLHRARTKLWAAIEHYENSELN